MIESTPNIDISDNRIHLINPNAKNHSTPTKIRPSENKFEKMI